MLGYLFLDISRSSKLTVFLNSLKSVRFSEQMHVKTEVDSFDNKH